METKKFPKVRTNILDQLKHDSDAEYGFKELKEKESRYVYRIKIGKKFYILKGLKIKLLPNGQKDAEELYTSSLRDINFFYQEYYFNKVACLFCPHFTKAIAVDYKVEIKEDPEPSCAYIEILLKYGGKDLTEHSCVKNINAIYNWMRQSAVALAVLHSYGITHLDLKPQNITYDKSKNLLRIIDMGSSKGLSRSSAVNKETKKMSMRECTKIFTPPEILQGLENKSLKGKKYAIWGVDVYSWAMTFYSLILEKSNKELKEEQNKYKVEGELKYEKFINSMIKDLKNVSTKNDEEKIMKEFIIDIFSKCMQFIPGNRPTFSKIIEEMKKLEEKNSIDIPFLKEHEKYKENAIKKLLLNSEKGEKKEDSNEKKQSKIIEELQETIKEKNKEIKSLKKLLEEKEANINKLMEIIKGLEMKHIPQEIIETKTEKKEIVI